MLPRLFKRYHSATILRIRQHEKDHFLGPCLRADRILFQRASGKTSTQGIELFIDGLCQPKNPGGIACYAFAIKQEANTIFSDFGIAAEPFSEHATNNVAEYVALIRGLEWLLINGYSDKSIVVKSDSQLVVKQLNKDYKVRHHRIIPLFKKAQ